jgi:hypothetical protein
MIAGIFEPFGKIDNIQLIMDAETNRSKGYGFITVSWGELRGDLGSFARP